MAEAKRTHKTVSDIEQAITLRTAGYSLTSIGRKLNISVSTLSRQFAALKVPKGKLSNEAVDLARQSLLADSGFIDGLKQAIAASIVDDIAQVANLRDSMALILEDIMADKALPAHYKSRAIAALATSLTLTQKVARVALAADDQPIEQDTLPTLFISELTNAEIETMRAEQLAQSGCIEDDDIIDEH